MARHVGRLGAQTQVIRRPPELRRLQALREVPDPARAPGLCKVYGPDGTLKAVLDPISRKPVRLTT